MGTRRDNGAGTDEKREDKYSTRVMVDGRRYRITADTKRELERKKRDLLHNADRGILPVRERWTLAQWIDRWLQDVVRRSVRTRTYEFYGDIMRLHVLPALGRIRLADLQPSHAEKLYGDLLERELSAQTVRHVHTVLHTCMAQAAKRNLVPRNVISIAEPPRVERREVEALTVEQVKTLLAAARGSRYEALLQLAVATGMRQSELIGLGWEAVDLDAGVIHVVRQLSQDGTFSEPKSTKGWRKIGIPSSVVVVLRQHRLWQIEERLLAGPEYESRHNLVFTTRSGRSLGHRNLLRDFKAILRKAGLPDVPFHALRHTHATLLFAQNVHGKVVQERLGHSSIAITLDRYSHHVPGLDRDAADRLGELLA